MKSRSRLVLQRQVLSGSASESVSKSNVNTIIFPKWDCVDSDTDPDPENAEHRKSRGPIDVRYVRDFDPDADNSRSFPLAVRHRLRSRRSLIPLSPAESSATAALKTLPSLFGVLQSSICGSLRRFPVSPQ